MKKMYFASMYLLFVIIFVNEIFDVRQEVYLPLIIGSTLLFLVSSLSITRGFQLYVSLISLVIGHIVILKYGLGFNVWYDSITKAIGMPVLFVAIPLIAFPIKHGGYLPAIESYIAAKRERPIYLFLVLTLIHLALSVALNIGSIPTMQKLLSKVNFPPRYLALLYTTGYSSYMVFSPYDGVVNMILLATSISYSEYFIGGLSMVILLIAMAAFLLKTDKRLLADVNARLLCLDGGAGNSKMQELLIHIAVLIMLAFVGEKCIPLSNSLYTIALLIIAYSLVWGYKLQILAKYKKELHCYSDNLLGCKSFLPFLIAAVFLGSVIAGTPLKEGMEMIMDYLNILPLYLIIQMLLLVTMVMSLCGIHMMITVPALAFTVAPTAIGLSNPAFALTLLTCWYMAMCISPLVPFAVIVAECIGASPLQITIKYNRKFALVMFLLAPIIIILVNHRY